MTDPTKKANSDFLKWYQSQKTLDTSGEISFGGKNGMYVIYSNTYGTLSFTHKDAWGIDGDTIYSLACTIPQKSKESLMKICDTMITSFKMVP